MISAVSLAESRVATTARTQGTVKGILVAGTEHDATSQPAVVDTPAHLHGAATLFSHLSEPGQEVAG